MATVTVVTAERTLEIEATSIVDGEINSAGHLILTRHDGTPLDMGAVSGVQVYNGTAYAKADVFSYVGGTDPGGVPNGSIWFDTTDVAGPVASETQKGLVELATNAEVIAGTDTQRAVTPAGLAAVPGYKVQIVSGIAESATPSAWPYGVSMQSITSSDAWTPNSSLGFVVTNSISSTRTTQTFYAATGGTQPALAWMRSYHSSSGGGGWTAWQQIDVINNLAAGSFTQTTAMSSYPRGRSRLYYNNSTSSGWDFSGKYGEVETYFDGTDYAVQTFTEHVAGSSAIPQVWRRTANAANGWSKWIVVAEDTGWINFGALPAGYTQQQQCRYRRRNGIVFLEGSFTAPSGGYTTALTLPTGFRPAVDKRFGITSNSTVIMSATVSAAGVVATYTSASTTAWFGLDDISFPVG